MPVLTPTSPITAVFCLGGNEDFVAAAGAAAPGSEVRRSTIEELRGEPDQVIGAQVVACCDAPPDQVADLLGQRDRTGLPRWPVVLFSSRNGTDGVAAEVIPRSEWNSVLAARSLQQALTVHRLRRDNARLRGELVTFGTRIAHDLRTPLGGILTTAEMLREVLAEGNPEDAALTQPIVDSSEALASLIERTSLFAKAIGSGAPLERFDMGTAFWSAFEQMESRMLRAEATLRQPPGWPHVEGNSGWMQIVWRNLLTNAIQHGGPKVRIEAGWAQEPAGVRFWLWDSGTVPAAKVPTLFHPFHQLHGPAAPRGLGLPMVRRLVEMQGGTCGFDVPAGGGSRFHFFLPAPLPPATPGNPGS